MSVIPSSNGHHPYVHPSTIALEHPGGPPERVLCFDAGILKDPRRFAPGAFCGFRSDPLEMATRLFPSGVRPTDFFPRSPILESDTDMKQIIACVVPWHAGTRQVWTYRRGGSEGRLSGKRSCLIGGHVNLGDGYGAPVPVDILDVTWNAALREMNEEAEGWAGNWKTHHSDCRLVLAGVLNDDSDDVGRVHFGFVYRLDMATLDMTKMSFAKEAGEGVGWGRVDDLRYGSPDLFESWTIHVVRHLAETSPVRSSC